MEDIDLKVVWTKINQTPEPRSFIQFLDAFNATNWLQAHQLMIFHARSSHDQLKVSG